MPGMIRVTLPAPLQLLSGAGREIEVKVEEPATLGAVLDAVEVSYPMLRGTLRDQLSKQRRPFIRFFACGEDLSMEPTTTSLPAEVINGEEPLRVVGAMAGG